MLRRPVLLFISVAALTLGAVACSDDEPARTPGGINGPARVNPNPGADPAGGSDDE